MVAMTVPKWESVVVIPVLGLVLATDTSLSTHLGSCFGAAVYKEKWKSSPDV